MPQTFARHVLGVAPSAGVRAAAAAMPPGNARPASAVTESSLAMMTAPVVTLAALVGIVAGGYFAYTWVEPRVAGRRR